MTNSKEEYFPQIEHYYEGKIYPFVIGLGLKELLITRKTWKSYSSPILLKASERELHKNQLACIEQCIRILFSEPNPMSTQGLTNVETKSEPTAQCATKETTNENAKSVFDIIKAYKGPRQ